MNIYKYTLIVFFIFVTAIDLLPQQVNAARIVVIKPKEGKNRDFELGYKRHLDWHIQNKDTWTWYGWQIIGGDNHGNFMDGTFAHNWEDFDNPVNPAGDAADNTLNVTPYADFISISHAVLMPDISNTALLETRQPSSYINFHQIEVFPGQEKEFEEFLTRLSSTFKDNSKLHTVYKLINGGRLPQYFIMFPVGKFAGIGSSPGISRKYGFKLCYKTSQLMYFKIPGRPELFPGIT